MPNYEDFPRNEDAPLYAVPSSEDERVKAPQEEQKPLVHTLVVTEEGHAVITEGEILTVYKKHDDGSFTEVWRGSLYSALRKLALTAWFD